MPGLIWSSKGEVLSGGAVGAGVPDGTAGGQFLVWNAAAGEWQAQAVTPGDIGAAAAAHTHDWAGITTAEQGGWYPAAGGMHYLLRTMAVNETFLCIWRKLAAGYDAGSGCALFHYDSTNGYYRFLINFDTGGVPGKRPGHPDNQIWLSSDIEPIQWKWLILNF